VSLGEQQEWGYDSVANVIIQRVRQRIAVDTCEPAPGPNYQEASLAPSIAMHFADDVIMATHQWALWPLSRLSCVALELRILVESLDLASLFSLKTRKFTMTLDNS
jgi:hypothetical protein